MLRALCVKGLGAWRTRTSARFFFGDYIVDAVNVLSFWNGTGKDMRLLYANRDDDGRAYLGEMAREGAWSS